MDARDTPQPAQPETGPIFLSYSGAHRDAATRLKQGLREAGVEVWQDTDQIHVGDRWVDTLQSALRQSSAYLILVGASGVHHWVTAELSYAIKRHFDTDGGFPIYPLLLPGVTPEDLPPLLSLFQAQRLPAECTPADYQALAQRIAATAQAPAEGAAAAAEGACPFPGLESYDEDTARFYFGRQVETLEALSRLGCEREGSYRRWLQVEGPSGVGKSSLVKAGMIPAIRRGWIEEQRGYDPRGWLIAVMRPGNDQVFNLAEALARTFPEGMGLNALRRELDTQDPESLRALVRQHTPAKSRFLLVVDQLEELFTLVADEQAPRRRDFDALLAGAVDDPDGSFHLITTIRSDFTLHLSELPRLAALLNSPRAGRYYLRPIDRTGLRDAVRTPARLAGLEWDEATLPERIVDEVAGQESALPLSNNLLRLLWQRRAGNVLSARDYQALGGAGGALARSADDLLESLGRDGKRRARDLLLRLVSVGHGDRATRRTISRATALEAAGGGAEAERALARLSGGAHPDKPVAAGPRLVTVSSYRREESGEQEAKVDLAHETLLTHWGTLRDWVRDHREQLEAEEALEEAARRWEQIGKPRLPGLPARGTRKRYRRARAPSALAKQYLGAIGWQSKLRWWGYGLVTLMLLAPVGFFGWTLAENITVSTGAQVLLTRWGPLDPPPEPDMVKVPAGSFMMGSPETDPDASSSEFPQHKVIIEEPFGIGKYEVTFEEYDAFVRATERRHPTDYGWGRDGRPVVDVNWDDAVAYARWLSLMTGKRYRLPTEAEWEYAARAGTTTRYWWGNEIDEDGKVWANCVSCGSQWDGEKTAPVGSFDRNPFEVYDTAGNVWEWVQDCWHDKYEGAPIDGSAWETDACGRRVIRGGSWLIIPSWVRSAIRDRGTPDLRDDDLGFRLAQDL